jgi:hypothetical protein
MDSAPFPQNRCAVPAAAVQIIRLRHQIVLIGDRFLVELNEAPDERGASGRSLEQTESAKLVCEVACGSQHVVPGHQAESAASRVRTGSA